MGRGRREPDIPARADMEWARETFGRREPRALFYRLTGFLMNRSLRGDSEFSQAEALSVLLLTWNARYYVARGRRFSESDYREIESFLSRYESDLAGFRNRSISDYEASDAVLVKEMFDVLRPTVGWTGVAKALHVCAPRFFPIWDSILAPKAYGIHKRDASGYIRLIEMTKQQVERAEAGTFVNNPVKEIDEWNYCRYSI